MADERDILGDAFEAREKEFARTQGISELDYAQLLELASLHAQATPRLVGAPAWRFVGPRNLGGRIIAVDQSREDPRILFVGSAHGGLWRSIDAGDTWERQGNDTHVFPVGAIAVAGGNSNVVYFGTGALHNRYVGGRGLFRASSPTPTGTLTIERLVAADVPTRLPSTATPGAALRYTRLRVDPYDPTRLWAASQTGLWKVECPLAAPAAPVFRREFPDSGGKPASAPLRDTPDAAGTWRSYCTDLLVSRDPRSDDTVRVGAVDVPRYLLLLVGIDGIGVYRGRYDRKDGTTDFDGSPLSVDTGGVAFGRIRLAQCERQPQHVYAVMANLVGDSASEVHHSGNSGGSWKKGAQLMSAVNAGVGQASYDLMLEVAPDDPSVVVCGALEVCRSVDHGSNWVKILNWLRYDRGDKAQHADQHIAMFDRGDHRRLWVGNDGGLIVARRLGDPPLSNGFWRKRSHGIYAGQCQAISVNPALPFLCAIGLQDNGSQLSYGGRTWIQVGGGDGGAVAFNLPNPRQLLTTWQGPLPPSAPTGQGIELVDVVPSDSPSPALPNSYYDLVTQAAGDLPETIARGHLVRYTWTAVSMAGSGIPIANSATFVGVLEQHPITPQLLLAGRNGDAFSSINLGTAWAPLIPLAPVAVGGDVGALAFGSVDARNPAGPAIVDGWAGTSAGALALTGNAPAGAWSGAPTALPFPGPALPISEIAVHPLDRRIVAVCATGLQGRIFLTFDRGRNWVDITEPVPTTLAVAPVGAAMTVGQVRAFSATATYPGAVVVNVTARATWTSSVPLQAAVGSAALIGGQVQGVGSEGHVTALAAGAPVITATLLAGVATGSASQGVAIAAGNVAPATPPAPPVTIVPGSLPPGPIASAIFDPAPAGGAAATLLAATMSGIYALTNVPVVQSLAIVPAAPVSLQAGAAALALRCDATFTDGTVVNVTQDVDWSSGTPAFAAVSNAPGLHGQVTPLSAGNVVIRADRGGQFATLAIVVRVGAAAAPAAPGPAPAAVAPVVAVNWQRHGVGIPNVLVTDLERVGTTNAIRAGTFGLGVFECVTAGGPLQQLYIRQSIIEDGRGYPRPNPWPIPDDPRLPAGIVALDHTHAFDIRVDAAPYTFPDDVADGVEFDEQIPVDDAVPTEINYVYVQLHNAGTTSLASVSVHLYAAPCAAADVINPVGAVATASPPSLEAGAPIADFYGQPNRDPIAGSVWTRVDTVRVLDEVPPDGPRVVRFTWVPDATLANTNAALLALCDAHPLSLDALPAAPAAATLSAFILAERRAALRVVRVGPAPSGTLYIRDGVADDTRLGGYPVAGRSPDIMVVRPDIGGTPEDAFKDELARRHTDTVSGTGSNIVYVRVHNRRCAATNAQVKLFAVAMGDDGRPDATLANWIEVPAGAANFAPVNVPALGTGYARLELQNAVDPNPAGLGKVYLLLALVQSADAAAVDVLPDRTAVTDADSFWNLVSKFVDADNAAARAIPWVP
ncbi:MAG: hypothetical protein ABI910_02855 [Gemmatimonadota bacterium]